MEAVTGLSYALTLGFPRCRRIQISPQRPAAFPRPQKPSCAARVTPFRQVPRAGLSPAFAYHQVTSAFPPTRHFDVAQPHSLTGSRRDRKEESHLPAPLACRASPITGTRLQAVPAALLPGPQPPFLGVAGQIGGLVSNDSRACGAGSPHSLVWVDEPFCVTSLWIGVA